MQEVIDFIKAFLVAEYEALTAQHAERDEKAYLDKKSVADGCLAPQVDSGIQRPSHPDENWFEDGKFIVESGQLIPRVLIQVKRYPHLSHGELFRIYLSNNNRPRKRNPRYFVYLFVARLNEGFKIVSAYHLQPLPPERGEGRFVDNGLVWLRSGGAQFKKLGKPDAMQKFQAPDVPKHLAEYWTE